jgi:NAD(P)-dependent dehydrogenase (short-subunit alcohol dehydrogenase family)
MFIDQIRLPPHRMAGMVAIVTGAGRGIGRETARVLARVGATVVVAEIDDDGQETVELIEQDGGKSFFFRTDVGDQRSLADLRDWVRAEVGEVDILINNAASFVIRPTIEQSPEEWDRQMAVNLGGAFNAVRLFVPRMVERCYGVVVFLGSAEGMPYLAAYSATKTALRSFSASLAAELGDETGVSVYLFNPGMVDTPGGRMAFERIAAMNGLSFDEFIAMAAPGGSLTTAEASATGLVGTIINAADFHGFETDYITGLARLGLASDGAVAENIEMARGAVPRVPRPEAAATNAAVEETLTAMIGEIDAASMFARPMLRRGFRQATGRTLEEFATKARSVSSDLTAGTLSELAATEYLSDLERLAALIEQQVGMYRDWERDPAKLEVGLAALAERKARVDIARETIATTQASVTTHQG